MCIPLHIMIENTVFINFSILKVILYIICSQAALKYLCWNFLFIIVFAPLSFKVKEDSYSCGPYDCWKVELSIHGSPNGARKSHMYIAGKGKPYSVEIGQLIGFPCHDELWQFFSAGECEGPGLAFPSFLSSHKEFKHKSHTIHIQCNLLMQFLCHLSILERTGTLMSSKFTPIHLAFVVNWGPLLKIFQE